MSSIVIQNGIVNYVVIGRGRPVVFLHGWLGAWRYWWSTLSALNGYRCYGLDLWGFGGSDKIPGQYDVDTYVSLLDEFLNQVGIAFGVPVIGHALGAAVAVRFAERFPEMVACVGTVSLPVVGKSINHRLYKKKDITLDRLISSKQAQSIYHEVVQDLDRADPEAITSSARSVAALDLRPALASLRTPVLAVHGVKDTIVAPPPREWIEATNQTHITPVLFEHSAHFPMLDEPLKFQRLLREFLVGCAMVDR
jgi:pimeloyl-ACP methyl ester carboxylesterase